MRVRLPLPAPFHIARFGELCGTCQFSSVVEQCFRKAEVPGSSPGTGSIGMPSYVNVRGCFVCYNNGHMIDLTHVSKSYDHGAYSLRDVTLHIKPGEFVSIVGQSGAGKTTFAKLLFAEERPTEGKIVIGDWDITRIRSAEVPFLRRQIGVVFQDFKLLPKKTVEENVSFALEVAGEPRSRIQEIVPKVLSIVGLENKSHRFPRELSGGEAQRVVIARALVHRPKILVADEPTGNLDTINTREIIDLLEKINGFGTTIVLVTHNREVVNALRRRVITLADGRVAADHSEGKYVLPS